MSSGAASEIWNITDRPRVKFADPFETYPGVFPHAENAYATLGVDKSALELEFCPIPLAFFRDRKVFRDFLGNQSAFPWKGVLYGVFSHCASNEPRGEAEFQVEVGQFAEKPLFRRTEPVFALLIGNRAGFYALRRFILDRNIWETKILSVMYGFSEWVRRA